MGRKNQTTTQNTVSEPWKQAQPYLQDVMQQAQNTYGQSGIGNTTDEALRMMTQTARGGAPGVDAANQYNTNVLSGQYLNEGNPYMDRIWSDQADQVTNRLKSLYSGMGRYGSEPMQNELAQSLGSLHSQLYGGAYEAERGRMTGAASMAPQLDQARYTAPQQMLMAGAYRDQAPMDALSWYNSIIGSMGQQGGTANSETVEPGPTFLQTLLGGLSGIGGFIGALRKPVPGVPVVSDRRAKTDIRRVGVTDGGLPIYTYRYITGDPRTYMGIMAQEALETQPEAVVDTGDLLLVDYTKVH